MNRREAFQKMALGMGYAIALPSAGLLIEACSQPAKDMGQLLFLNNDEAILLEAMAEAILPETDSSPGAKNVGVITSIDLLLNNLLSFSEQVIFRKSLAVFSKAVNFVDLDTSGKESALKNLIKSDKDLFSTIKKMTVLAYFTMEEVAKNVMNFNPLPEKYEPCVEVGPDVKGWYD